MAIIRRVLKCSSCDQKTITRTAVGFASIQPHTFPCPVCGVEIGFSLKVNMQRMPPSFSFSRPTNGRWVTSEKDAVHTLNFDSERASPKDMSQTFSPFMAEYFKLSGPAHDA